MYMNAFKVYKVFFLLSYKKGNRLGRVNNLFKVTQPIALIWAKFAWSRSYNFCLQMTFCALVMNRLISGGHCPHCRKAGPSTVDTPLLVPPLAPLHEGPWLSPDCRPDTAVCDGKVRVIAPCLSESFWGLRDAVSAELSAEQDIMISLGQMAALNTISPITDSLCPPLFILLSLLLSSKPVPHQSCNPIIFFKLAFGLHF